MIDRRSLLRTAPGIVAVGASISLAGCAPAVVAAAGGAAGGAAGAWFTEFGKAIAAELAAKVVNGAANLVDEWKDWAGPAKELAAKQAAQGYAHTSDVMYGHTIPGTTLTAFTRTAANDPQTGRIGCARQSGELVVLESWAWKAVQAFVAVEIEDKEGDDRIHILQLLVATLMPRKPGKSGSSPRKSFSWTSFHARDGDVEIVKFVDGGKPRVTITATGFHTRSAGNPTSHTFDLV